MSVEITITELSSCTGLKPNHILQLCKRGILPEGRKGTGDDYKSRYLPAATCLKIIQSHIPGTPWRARAKETNPRLNWKTLA